MLSAFFWGLVATSSLILGGWIATRFKLGKKRIGIIMAFGAGTLISAVSYELIFEAVQMARLSGFPALGLFAGALTFFGSDALIAKFGGRKDADLDNAPQSKLVVPMVLAIILDGIPESIVIGLGILEGGTVSLAMMAAIFISNLPEAIAGTVGMQTGGAEPRQDPFPLVRHRVGVCRGVRGWLCSFRPRPLALDCLRAGFCRRCHTDDAC